MDKRPDVSDMHPEQITTVAQLATALRTVLARSGLSIREAARTAQSTSKVAASKSTFAEMLKGERLPAKGSMVAFLSVCGLTADQIRPWQRAWEHLSDSFVGPVDDRAPAPSQGSLAPSSLVVQQTASDTVRPQVSVPGARYRPWSRAVTLSAFVLVVLTALGGAIALIARGDDLSGSLREGSPPLPAGQQGDRPPSIECRGQWVSMESLYVLPCIGKGRDGLIISADVRAKDPQGVPSGATVWIWLMNVENVNMTRLHLTRDQTTLRSCKIQLADNSRTQTCGPFVVKPPKPGTYTTSSLASHQPSLLPPGWHSPIISGSQAIAKRTWKP